MTPDAEPGPPSAFRWGRLWFTVALLIAGAWLTTAWRGRPPAVTIRLEVWEDMEITLEHEGWLRHPPAREAERIPPRRFEGRKLAVDLEPGHYRITLRRAGSAEPWTLPLLAIESAEEIAWRISEPPPGFVPIPRGPFLESRRGPVRATGDLVFAARHEVSRADYARFLRALADHEATGSPFSPWDGEAERIAYPDGSPGHGRLESLELERHEERARWPVTFVSYYDAQAYCNWLTAEHGQGRWRFRLPTALEWDKASRGTDGRVYPWGDRFESDPFLEAKDRSPLPVDALPERRSPFGLFLAEGNVAEWTADAADPAAVRRVVRGRSWSSSGDMVRLGAGVGDPATRRAPEIGFRVFAEPVRSPGDGR